MKKGFFSLLLGMTATTIPCQVPNGNFEEWEAIDNIEQPKYWKTNNYLCCHPVVKTGDAIEGNFSMKISSTAPSIEGTLPGHAEIKFLPQQIYQTLTASIRIDSIEKGKVFIEVFQLSNGNYQQIGYWKSTVPTNGVDSIAFSIAPTKVDSLRIRITAANTPTPTWSEGYSELIIDELHLTTDVLNNKESGTICPGPALKLRPNPATDFLSFEIEAASKGHFSWQIATPLGQVAHSGEGFFNQKTNVDVSPLPAGLYTISAFSENGGLLKAEKFVVMRE